MTLQVRNFPSFRFLQNPHSWSSLKGYIPNNHQEFQVPKTEVLNLRRLIWGWVSPYISLTYSLCRSPTGAPCLATSFRVGVYSNKTNSQLSVASIFHDKHDVFISVLISFQPPPGPNVKILETFPFRLEQLSKEYTVIRPKKAHEVIPNLSILDLVLKTHVMLKS